MWWGQARCGPERSGSAIRGSAWFADRVAGGEFQSGSCWSFACGAGGDEAVGAGSGVVAGFTGESFEGGDGDGFAGGSAGVGTGDCGWAADSGDFGGGGVGDAVYCRYGEGITKAVSPGAIYLVDGGG